MPYGTIATLLFGQVGVDVDEAPHATRKWPLGYIAIDRNGRRYRYVGFNGTVPQYSAVALAISATPYASLVVSTNLNESLAGVFFHATSALAGEFGWLLDKGLAIVKTSGVTAASSHGLGASATDGTLTDLVSTAQTTQAEAQRIIAALSGVKARALTNTDTPVTGTSYVELS